jgi:hypothetical protein
VSLLQELGAPRPGAWIRHPTALPVPGRLTLAGILATVVGVAISQPPALQAQSRGSLQVTAQVVSTAPIQQALAQGSALLQQQELGATQSLATVELQSSGITPASEPADPPKQQLVLTISFVYN